MKVLLFSLLSAIAGIAIYAENPVGYSYTPLVREGVEWGYKWTYYPLKEGSYYLQLSGDTLINSKTYKVCYRYATVDFQKEDAMVYGFVREEGKRIYAIGRRVPNGTNIDMYNYYDKDALEERLIYDFDWKIGDTYRPAADEPHITITGIKYVEVNGKKRKAFFATLNGATSESLFAIEGIGFIGSRPFEADMMNPNLNECACMPEYVVELEFMQKTDDRFHYEFRRDDFDFSFGSAESINPDSPGLRLSADNLYFNASNPDRLTASLADTSGRIVAAATMEDGTTAINVAQLPEGIYIATLKSDKELILSEKILVSHR